MIFLQQIVSAGSQRKLGFLVIGGFAVIFHGCSRDTADLDLLVRREDRAAWVDYFVSQGYTVLRDAGSFIQFQPPEGNAWPVDLMLVADSTFEPMLAGAIEVDMYDTKVRIPSLEHLLALKLHALKHGHVGRFSKDFLDVEALVRVNRLDLRSEPLRSIFLKYGTLDLYEKISRALASE
jgi:predicted nucleotidyltransferase